MHTQPTPPLDQRAATSISQRAILRRLVCRSDEVVFLEGDEASHRYEVVAGAVRACRLLPDGRRQVLDFFLPGDPFGHDELDRQHGYSAEAAGIDGTVLTQHRQLSLVTARSDDAESCVRLRDQALRSLHRTRTRLLILGRLEAPERLAAFLLEMEARLLGRCPARDPRPFTLPMSRRDAADYLGITPETLSRCIQDLRRRAVIDVCKQRQVSILDRRTLQHMSCGAAEVSERGRNHAASRLSAVA